MLRINRCSLFSPTAKRLALSGAKVSTCLLLHHDHGLLLDAGNCARFGANDAEDG